MIIRLEEGKNSPAFASKLLKGTISHQMGVELVDVVNDRFGTGIAAGFVGSVYMLGISIILGQVLGLIRTPFFVWGGILLFGHRPENSIETAVAMIFQLGLATGIGALYPYIFSLTAKRNYRIKGVFFGLAVWLAFYSAARLFRMPTLMEIDWPTVVANSLNSAIYGWIVAEVAYKLDGKKFEEIHED